MPKYKKMAKRTQEDRELRGAIVRLSNYIATHAAGLGKGCPEKVALALAHKVYKGEIESAFVAARDHVLTKEQLAERRNQATHPSDSPEARLLPIWHGK